MVLVQVVINTAIASPFHNSRGVVADDETEASARHTTHALRLFPVGNRGRGSRCTQF